MTFQAYVFFSKASWILCEIIRQSPGFAHEMKKEDISHYNRLLEVSKQPS